MDLIRTFVAVDLAPLTRRKIDAFLKPWSRLTDVGIRWTPPSRWHITLVFLGDVETRDIITVCDAVRTAAAQAEPFSWRPKGLGAFPSWNRPRVVWVGVEDLDEALAPLQKRVLEAIQNAGIEPEDTRFHPHITVGRIPKGAKILPQLGESMAAAKWEGPTEHVESLQVMSSSMDRTGSDYAILANLPIGDEIAPSDEQDHS